MINLEPTLRVGEIPPSELRKLADVWRIGAVLPARVVSSFGERLRLQLGAAVVEAKVPPEGLPTQNFQVRIIALQPEPVLEILARPTNAPLQAALRSQLPLQLGQNALLADLAVLTSADASVLWNTLPSTARSALLELLASIPTTRALSTGEGLRRAIEQAGNQLEYRLRVNVQQPSDRLSEWLHTDWKANLLKLLESLPASPSGHLPEAAPTPPPLARQALTPQPRLPKLPLSQTDADLQAFIGTLRQHVHGALARINIAVLESHPLALTQTPTAMAWMIELPLQTQGGYDLLALRIHREPSTNVTFQPNAHVWRLAFAMDLPKLGPIEGDVSLVGDNVDVNLWAERNTTQQQLQGMLDSLATNLREVGLKPHRLSCHIGLQKRARIGSSGLLDTTA